MTIDDAIRQLSEFRRLYGGHTLLKIYVEPFDEDAGYDDEYFDVSCFELGKYFRRRVIQIETDAPLRSLAQKRRGMKTKAK